MPVVMVIVLWIVLSLVTAPIIGALFVARDRRRMKLHVSENEPKNPGKEPPGPGSGGQGG
jgi:uncharacterized protein YneF (UPF0154 family)